MKMDTMACQALFLLICLHITFRFSHAFQHNRFARQAESGWSEWSVWSVCSRSCGGGVSYQERYCLAGEGFCLGPQRNYRSCQIQDCPEDAVDFRLEQCASFNDVPYEGRVFKWMPYEGGPNKCELNCMPKGEHFYYRQAEKVIDGTRCTADSLDVCVDGDCRHVGCDMMLDSYAVEDMCGECGGDNSTCRVVKGKFTRRRLPEGYNDIHIIPAGATNVHISEMRGSHNYLALRNRFDEYYLNGDFSIDLPHSFKAAGTMIHYKRKLGSPNHSPEAITFSGPTEEPLFLVLLTQGRNHGIEYSYYVPNGVGPNEPVSYSWSYTEYSNCTKECGGGKQTRTVTCTRSGDFDPVPTYLCDPVLKPGTNRTCNADPCPPRWFIGEWTPCSQSCDEGTQVRQVYCQQVLESGRTDSIDETYCFGVLGEKPEYQKTCTIQRCPHWDAGEWSECSAECGEGIQTRQVQCVADLPEPEQSCYGPDKPEDEQTCNLGPCEGVDWLTSQWTSCSGICGHGSQSRQLKCATQGGTTVSKDLCDMQQMPQMTVSCPVESGCGPRWVATHWSECSATCGGGVHSRLVFCADVQGNLMSQVQDSNCNASIKFETEELCNMELCSEDYVWFLGPWGKCTVPCGGGTRTRTLVCMKGETPQRQALCDAGNRPITTDQCNMDPCTPDELQDSSDGVECSDSEFGCCEDGVTAATGPFKKGCRITPIYTRYLELNMNMSKCELTEFKCCPDGVTAATGWNFEGCEQTETEELNVESAESINCEAEGGCDLPDKDDPCMLPMDPGICRAWIVRYFFDVNYGQCTQFWYGGCGGNANLFESYEECRNECVGDDEQLTQEELCILPKVVGPCKGSHPSYYYDAETGSCESFKYGGCRGNQNRFRTEADCEIACGTFNSDPCTLDVDYGDCRGSEVRWFFNILTGMCEDFEYSGCLGNMNRFLDKQTCEQRCNANYENNVQYLSKYDQCRVPSVTGECNEIIPEWTYDVRDGQCKEFIYGGCDGNDNRFDDEQSCLEACFVEGKTLCERMRGLFEASGIQDEPQCKFDGSFEPLQCPPRTGDCWCVTDEGDEIEGSRITRELHTLRPDCSVYWNSAGNTEAIAPTTTTAAMEMLSLCERHQRTAEGSYVPQCTASGEYEPMQCYGSNMDYCWCVNENGEEIDFTRTLPGQEKPQCVGILNSVCFTAYRAVMSGRLESQYMPQCTPQGLFAKLQCHTERGCLCVEENSGTVLYPINITPDMATPQHCNGHTLTVMTPCQRQRQESILASEGSSAQQYIPECTPDGSYLEVQCYQGHARYCWCVNERGEEIPSTRQRDSEPDCSAVRNELERPSVYPEVEHPNRVIQDASLVESSPSEEEKLQQEQQQQEQQQQNTVESGVEVPPTTDLVTERVAAVTLQEDGSESGAETTTVITSTEAAILDRDYVVITEEEEEEETSSTSITQTQSTVTARPGNMVVLTCEAVGNPPPAIRWERYGQDVATLDGDRLVVNSDGTLNILSARVSDSGPYLCIADNGIGEPDMATFEIKVAERQRRPMGRQSRIKTREGERVTLPCRARGSPEPVFTWEFQGLELSDIEPRITKLPSGSLRLSNVGLSDVGTYKCTARNMYGIVQMKTFTLIVEADVKIVDPPSSQKAAEGDTVTLRCGTTGSPKPKIRWSVDNSPIPNTHRFTIGANDELIIQDIKLSDSGRYSCTAANGISSKTAFAEINVTGNEVDPNCQDQPQYVSCELIVFAKLCTDSRYYKYCCRTCQDNSMIPLTTPAP